MAIYGRDVWLEEEKMAIDNKCRVWLWWRIWKGRTSFVLEAGVGDDDPKVDGLLGSELFVVPAAFDADVAVLVERHPRRVVAHFERLALGRLLQLEHELALGLAVLFAELDALGRPQGARRPPLDAHLGVVRRRRRRRFLSARQRLDDDGDGRLGVERRSAAVLRRDAHHQRAVGLVQFVGVGQQQASRLRFHDQHVGRLGQPVDDAIAVGVAGADAADAPAALGVAGHAQVHQVGVEARPVVVDVAHVDQQTAGGGAWRVAAARPHDQVVLRLLLAIQRRRRHQPHRPVVRRRHQLERLRARTHQVEVDVGQVGRLHRQRLQAVDGGAGRQLLVHGTSATVLRSSVSHNLDNFARAIKLAHRSGHQWARSPLELLANLVKLASMHEKVDKKIKPLFPLF